MTVEEMVTLQGILCNKLPCDECLLAEYGFGCVDEPNEEFQEPILRMIPKALELTESPAIKKFLAWFVATKVV